MASTGANERRITIAGPGELVGYLAARLIGGHQLQDLPLRGRQQRYRIHRDSLYVFLHRDDVEPTNNSSERDLRPSVIHRKVIGGFRSAWGAEASAIRTTILTAAREQARNLLDAFRAVAGPSPLHALPARS